MKYELTKHAQKVLKERGIFLEWVEYALVAPELIVPEPDDMSVERLFLRIPEFDNRVLRVVVNRRVYPSGL
ncbi:MAG TPA: DUF4258 domain-containing protein [Candidatus Hydrogenedentes bacterium]|jgi:hypothetical protein|nr:DUF4258 domain-containing protein [Candidatus Hydrogenedentota bacterium]